MFYDEAKIIVKAGDGGKGCVSFRREKYVPRGGPDGGDGGKGGDIVFKTNSHLNTLAYFNVCRYFKGNRGQHGQGKNKKGYEGKNLILEVPVGTQVKEDGNILADLTNKNMEFTAALGGRGGKGNASFKSSVRQAPKFAELGEEGEKRSLKLVLKLIADVGIIGLPNAGKSTLLSRISNARPKIAPYPFTTIKPNLGVVILSPRKSFTVCDIPGLIEGAAEGKGMGHKFLRHIERTRVLIHLIDCTVPDIKKAHNEINNELKLYSRKLPEKKQIICLNKIDILPKKQLEQLEELKQSKYLISAVSGKGIEKLLWKIWETLKTEKRKDQKTTKQQNKTTEHIFKPFEGDTRNFKIEKTKGIFKITGKRIEQITNMTDFKNWEAVARLRNILEKIGAMQEVDRLGYNKGDRICIGTIEITKFLK